VKGIPALLVTLTVLTFLPAASRPAGLQVLWDQSAIDWSSAACLPDAAAGCGPGVDTIHQASDFRVDQPATLMRVTTYYTATDSDAFCAIVEAWLWIAPKRGRRPDTRHDDPRRSGHLVPVSPLRVGDHHELVASDLAVDLHPGEYWISLTPVVPAGVLGPEIHLCSAERYGDPSVAYRICSAERARWSDNGNGLDAALLVEGERREPAAAAGIDWPWRFPR
jgi:hypothetical protein